ncbi:MAG: YciI family protein [Anaerolineae bacterium]
MTKTVAVFLHHGSRWDPARGVREQEHWDAHARFMDALFDAGQVVLAGPFADDSGSMVILAVDSVEIARAIFQEDPWARQDILLTADVKEWTIFMDSR